jgi:hypothetical protein
MKKMSLILIVIYTVLGVSLGMSSFGFLGTGNKKFCGGPGGGFSKEPPGRRRHFCKCLQCLKKKVWKH